MHDTLRVRTLGGLQLTSQTPETWRAPGAPSAKAEALLAYLAVTERAHSRSALAGLLWSDLPEDAARANLRLTLTKIRKWWHSLLAVDRASVGLAPDLDLWVDVHDFARVAAAGDAEEAREATGLYTGPFLDGFVVPGADLFTEWAERERASWHTVAVEAVGRQMTAARERGDFAWGAAVARRLVQLEAYQEEAHRALMWFLARDHQATAALAQFDTCRHILGEELGVALSPKTVALAEQIRRGAGFDQLGAPAPPADAPASPSDAPAVPAPRASPEPSPGLAPTASELVGRSAEVDRVRSWLRDPQARVVSLVGPGGVGKTRLALAVAEACADDFPDGVYVVTFSGTTLTAADEAAHIVVAGVAEQVGLPLSARRDPLLVLGDFLAARRCLLVLDNVETVPDVSGVLAALCTRAPHVRVLVTSRVRLGLGTEWVLEVSGLAFPGPDDEARAEQFDAVALFLHRARAVRPGFDVRGHRHDVARLCRAVEGLPLGLELASRWVRAVPVGALADRVETGLELLSTSASDVLPRHRSMRAVLDASWQMLDGGLRTLAARLSVFRGGFDLPAAAEVAGATAEDLAALVDHSFLTMNDTGRYLVHDLLGRYLGDRLAGAGDEAATLQARHAACFERRVGQVRPSLTLSATVAAVDVDIENMRVATAWLLAHADTERLGAYLDSVVVVVRHKGWFGEMLALAGAAQARTDASPVLRARWHRYAGEAHIQLGQLIAGRRCLETALAAVGRPVPRHRVGWGALFVAQLVLWVTSRFRVVRRHPRAERAARARETAWACWLLTEVVYLRQERLPAGAVPLVGVNAARRSRDRDCLALCQADAALPLSYMRLHRLAARTVRAASALSATSSDPVVRGYVPVVATLVHLGLADWARADASAARGARVGEQHQLHRLANQARLLGAVCAFAQGRYADADRATREVAVQGRARGDPMVAMWALFTRAQAAMRSGRPGIDEVRRWVDEALPLLSDDVPPCDVAGARAIHASVLLREGRGAESLTEAREAVRYATSSPVVTQYTIAAYATVCEVVLDLGDLAARGALPGSGDLRRLVADSVATLRRYADVYPVGIPDLLVCRGRQLWARGRRRAALRSWAGAAQAARRLHMPYEEARAHVLLGEHLPASRRSRLRMTAAEHGAAARQVRTYPSDVVDGFSPSAVVSPDESLTSGSAPADRRST
ncbi:MAG: AfsR/SARP family transcriptional regulator [Actinomycetes bacterium]